MNVVDLQQLKNDVVNVRGDYSKVASHLNAVREVLNNIILDDVVEMTKLIKSASIVYVIGNGGSAALAAHFAQDLLKSCRVRAMALDSVPAFTAFSNDHSYTMAFSSQLERWHSIGDDAIVVAISTSGDSKNIVLAAHWANENDVLAIGLTGAIGGYLKDYVDLWLAVKDASIEVVEDAHAAICHAVVRLLKDG